MARIYTGYHESFLVEEKALDVLRLIQERETAEDFIAFTRIKTIGWNAGEPFDSPLYLKVSDIIGVQ